MFPNQAPPPTGAPTEGQGENWEARFKGIQPKYESTLRELEAAQALATTLQQQMSALKNERQGDHMTFQQQLSTVQAEALTHKQSLEALVVEKKALAEKLSTFEQKETARAALRDVGATDLISFLDSGNFSTAGMTGEELKARVEGFRTDLVEFARRNVQQQLGGSSPPNATQPAANAPVQNKEALFEWLNDERNFDSPQWDQNRSLYLSLNNK